MGERKVVNKYYPPDFDPLKLRKPKMPPDKQVKTRMMLPFTCKCSVCGTYLHIGTKFNMRKETLPDESYLGIEVIRFFFKCTRCTTEITMKTDPRNHDYICESNATRQYDERRDLEAAEEALNEVKVDEDRDPMKFLEARTFESRREMEILDNLADILSLNKIQAKVTPDDMLQKVYEKRHAATGGTIQPIKRISQDNVPTLQKQTNSGEQTSTFRRLQPKFLVKKRVIE